METESRKRPAKGTGDEGRKLARVRSDGSGTATDAEVEEFFAILRRIHAAARYFGKGKTAAQPAGESHRGSDVTGTNLKWRPTFEWEDFETGLVLRSEEGSAISGVPSGRGVATGTAAVGTEGEKRAEKESRVFGSLDLNTEPEPETHPS